MTCTLFGSLGATGLGHGTPDAIVAGLRGDEPDTVDPDAVRRAWSDWPDGGTLALGGTRPIAFEKADIVFAPRTRLPGHPNAMTLTALGGDGETLAEHTYYSIGGGFIRRDGEAPPRRGAPLPDRVRHVGRAPRRVRRARHHDRRGRADQRRGAA